MKLRGLVTSVLAFLMCCCLVVSSEAVEVAIGIDYLTSQGPELMGVASVGSFGGQFTVMPVYRSDPYFTTQLIGTGTLITVMGRYQRDIGPIEAYLGLGGSMMSLFIRAEDPLVQFPPSNASSSGLAAIVGARYEFPSLPVSLYAGATYMSFSDIQIFSGGTSETLEFEASGIGFHFGLSYTFSLGDRDADVNVEVETQVETETETNEEQDDEN